jgi:hypothetical protein
MTDFFSHPSASFNRWRRRSISSPSHPLVGRNYAGARAGNGQGPGTRVSFFFTEPADTVVDAGSAFPIFTERTLPWVAIYPLGTVA